MDRPIVPMFAQTPSDAFQLRVALIATAQRMLRARVFSPFVDETTWQDINRAAQRIDPYLWTPKTQKVVAVAAESYPLESKVYVPALTHALSVFSAPLLDVVITGKACYLSALIWSYASFTALPEKPQALQFYGLVWEGANVTPVVRGTWPILKDSDKHDESESAKLDIGRFARFALAASAFVEQRVVVPSSVPLNARQAQIAKAAKILPSLHVINLRAVDRTLDPPSQGEGGQREYECRWFVRGHWRKQYHPREGRHVPTWIDTHIKGPEDKPLRQPLPTVFSVTR